MPSERAMRLLTRYILKEIAAYFLLGLAVFSFVIYIQPLSQLLDLLVRGSLGFGRWIELFLLPIPSILTMTVPMAVTLGVLMGLGRMSADGEVVAASAAGIGRGQFIRPALLFAGAAVVLTSWLSLSLSPKAARTLSAMESRLAATEATYNIRPRVFLEQFPKVLLYIRDVTHDAQEWKGIFITDATASGPVKVTLAKTGALISDHSGTQLTFHLADGTTQEMNPKDPNVYTVLSFSSTDIPLPALHEGSGPLRPSMLPVSSLLKDLTNPATRRTALVELNYRLALPFAAVVLVLVGVAVGLSGAKRGKGVGLILTIGLVFFYYILMASGRDLALGGKLNPFAGLWGANIVFAAVGSLALFEWPRVKAAARGALDAIENGAARFSGKRPAAPNGSASPAARPRGFRLLSVMDGYVLRNWVFYFLTVAAAFAGIYMVFDFFQLLSSIVRFRMPVAVVLKYYWFLSPQVFYLMAPLAVLMATLITFGVLSRRNEVIAARALGISLYRLAMPVLVAGALLSGAMYVLGNDTLPSTNLQQDTLRNEIKGNPPQTGYRQGRQWISGESNSIYDYRYFDPARNEFADLSVFELSKNASRLQRRIYAQEAFWQSAVRGWVLENGWVRDFKDGNVASFRRFTVSVFPEFTESPEYFKTDVKPSEQMSVEELRQYILDLRKTGVDVVSLWVAFYKKFSYPLIALVMALIGLPFAFSGGRRGALWGIALSFGIAIAYWALASVFESLGYLGQLPPSVAAWSPDVLFGLAGAILLLRVKT